jgi:hypothetical protein
MRVHVLDAKFRGLAAAFFASANAKLLVWILLPSDAAERATAHGPRLTALLKPAHGAGLLRAESPPACLL